MLAKRRGRKPARESTEPQALDLEGDGLEDVELEGLDADGRGLSGGTRHRAARLEEDDETDLPDVAPPGYPG